MKELQLRLKEDEYLSKKTDWILKNLGTKGINLIDCPTGGGKTTFAIESIINSKKVSIFLAPLCSIVDQVRKDLSDRDEVLIIDDIGLLNKQMAFGFKGQLDSGEEVLFSIGDNQSPVYVGTYASFVRHFHEIDFNLVEYIFIDEIHQILEMSDFARDTIVPFWEFIRYIGTKNNIKRVGLTAETDLILQFKTFWNIDTLIKVNIDSWRLMPKEIYVYGNDFSVERAIEDYLSNYVEKNDKMLFLTRFKKQNEKLPKILNLRRDIETISSRNKLTSRAYESIVKAQQFPDGVNTVLGTSLIQTGVNIKDSEVKHVVCLFQNLHIAKQVMSRIRTGNVNLVIFMGESQTEEFTSRAFDASQIDKKVRMGLEYRRLTPLNRNSKGMIDFPRIYFNELSMMNAVVEEQQKCFFGNEKLLTREIEKRFFNKTPLFIRGESGSKKYYASLNAKRKRKVYEEYWLRKTDEVLNPKCITKKMLEEIGLEFVENKTGGVIIVEVPLDLLDIFRDLKVPLREKK